MVGALAADGAHGAISCHRLGCGDRRGGGAPSHRGAIGASTASDLATSVGTGVFGVAASPPDRSLALAMSARRLDVEDLEIPAGAGGLPDRHHQHGVPAAALAT